MTHSKIIKYLPYVTDGIVLTCFILMIVIMLWKATLLTWFVLALLSPIAWASIVLMLGLGWALSNEARRRKAL